MKPVLITPRLRLRPLTMADAPRLSALGNDLRVARMIGGTPYPYTPDKAAEFVGRHSTTLREGGRVWGICDSAGLQGLIAFFVNPQRSTEAEFGYWLGAEAWGKGYATEAGRAALEEAFARGGPKAGAKSEGPGFQSLLAGCFFDNPPSERVLSKLGFRDEGEVTQLFSAGRGAAAACKLLRLAAADRPAPPPLLETKRLILAPLQEEEAAELARIGDSPEIARCMANLPSPFTEDLALARIRDSRFRGAPGFRLGIRRRKERDLVGELGVGPKNEAGWPDLSYWLGREFRGQGYAREAAGALADYLFAAFEPARIRAEADSDNAPSQRLLEALGFAEADAYLLGEDLIRRYELRRAVWAERPERKTKPRLKGAN